MNTCSCQEVLLNGQPTGSKNIDDKCLLHGIGTDYYHDLVEKHNIRNRELFAQAREARRKIKREE